jgi:hypothetical protein
MRIKPSRGVGLSALMTLTPVVAAEVELIDATTPWRTSLVTGPVLYREEGKLLLRAGSQPAVFEAASADPAKLRFSPMPPEDWTKPDFDDGCWTRYRRDELNDFMGDFGIAVAGGLQGAWPALLCLRTCFGIADPERAADVKVVVEYLGGAVVYVNGQEVGRGHLSPKTLHPLTPAEDYPIEAYTTEDGKTPLPTVQWGIKVEEKWEGRYVKRVRALSVSVSRRALVKGRNVLAVALHWAPLAGPTGQGCWGHAGVRRISLTSASGGGVIPYADAARGTRLWSAGLVEQVSDTVSETSLVKKSWFWQVYTARCLPVKGVQAANPFDPVLPVRMVVPRNGVCSGQTVLSDAAGVKDLQAALGPLKGPGGAAIPAAGVQIRFAAQNSGVHYCDGLMPEPPRDAKTVPVWLVIRAPRDQAPGWYAATLGVAANGKTFSVPVHVLVADFAVPDAKDFASVVGVTHSAETVALHYKVEPWSEAHFKLMEKSLELVGQVGNDIVHVPVITRNQFRWQLPIVRWAKTADGLEPDFVVLEKYLDACLKHCAPPQALVLYLWEESNAREVADAYEGRRLASVRRQPRSPPMVALLDRRTWQTSEISAPDLSEEGAEPFWRPMIEGVRAIVRKRGWSERILMLGLGGDVRPGETVGETMREWAPYARWNLLSHFSGDPPPKDGRLIATGGLEVGLKEWPASNISGWNYIEAATRHPLDFLEIPNYRWEFVAHSPPLAFRTAPLLWGRISRIGLDFWLERTGAAPRFGGTRLKTDANCLTVPGPDGAIPTVRFQMLREAVQEVEARAAIRKALPGLPEARREFCQALLQELVKREAWGYSYLSQHELGYDWPAYVARIYRMASEVTAGNTEAVWDAPPK